MNFRLRHRCYEHATRGVIAYDPPRANPREWTAVIEVEEEIARLARWHFKRRHGIELLAPDHPAHMTLAGGPGEWTEQMERAWGALDGERVEVLYTQEMFWKDGFVWLNAYCKEYFLIREALFGMDHSDNELWGHITVGRFPEGEEPPRFLDYHDLFDWPAHP